MNKFEIGDRVTLKKNTFLTIEYVSDNGDAICLQKIWEDCDDFELVERKIGDTWFKPEELYVHENALPFKDEEADVHEDNKMDEKLGLINSDYMSRNKIFESPEKWACTNVVEDKSNHKNYISDGEKWNLKEEFKVDKLGWYESRKGDFYEVVRITNETKKPIIALNQNSHLHHFTSWGGCFENMIAYEDDLIKYLGPELPKEPRKFEFEGCIKNGVIIPVKGGLYNDGVDRIYKIKCEEIINE